MHTLPRCLLKRFLPIIVALAPCSSALSGETVPLGDVIGMTGLDDDKAVTEKGVFLRPRSVLWIDLKGAADHFTATVLPASPDPKQTFSWQYRVGTKRGLFQLKGGAKSQNIDLNLTGESYLEFELEGQSRQGQALLLTNASITYHGAKPEMWNGFKAPFWQTPSWTIGFDDFTGAIGCILNPMDTVAAATTKPWETIPMNWIRFDGGWGGGVIRTPEYTGDWNCPTGIKDLGETAMEVTYQTPVLSIAVHREIDAKSRLGETYTFTNTTNKTLNLPEGALGILTPLCDDYPGSEVCVPKRCDVHIWTGGNVAYINALRMGGAAPHLGMVMTEGSLTSYSIFNRPWNTNDRGLFILNTGAITLEPGKSFRVSWLLFWHKGWDDFFSKALQIPGFIRLDAEHYTVSPGEPLKVTAEAGESLDGAKLLFNGIEISVKHAGNKLNADIPTTKLGDQLVELELNGRKTFLRAFVSPPPMDLIASRVKFILEHQQINQPGQPTDGAYLPYDNDTNKIVIDNVADHNSARERLAMGVLLAQYLSHCDEPALKHQITESLEKYYTFIEREIQDPAGVVWNAPAYKGWRLYNPPWVAHFHLEMYRSTRDPKYLKRYVDTVRAYYSGHGEKYYCIGMPILDGLMALKQAGMDKEHDELLALFQSHADVMLKNGVHYPSSEVAFEESIAGPAIQILLETYLATKDAKYLEGAKLQLPVLEAFCGKQPDHRLHEVSIRHWDDYWFGKRRLYGDTMPHYWSTIVAVVYNEYAHATGDASYFARADEVLRNNFSLFTPDGRGSCAHVYPFSISNDADKVTPGNFNDPRANDQDWALVYWLMLHDRKYEPPS